MAVTISIKRFSGPLDLLLELIHARELEVSEISLKEVTDQFIRYLDQDHIPANELTDFLTVAVKLVLLKTRSLLPYLEMEDEGEEELEKQLKMYEVYWKAAKKIDAKSQAHLFGKIKNPQLTEVIFSPPTKNKISKSDFAFHFKSILDKIEPQKELPITQIKKAVSLSNKIMFLRTLLEKSGKISFRNFLRKDNASKTDLIVNFLAALELIKQNEIEVEGEPHDITLIRISK